MKHKKLGKIRQKYETETLFHQLHQWGLEKKSAYLRNQKGLSWEEIRSGGIRGFGWEILFFCFFDWF